MRRRTLTGLFATFWIAFTPCVVVAQQAPQEIPSAFPRAGARQVLDNERVTVWDEVHREYRRAVSVS